MLAWCRGQYVYGAYALAASEDDNELSKLGLTSLAGDWIEDLTSNL